jgi:hypothetical protein
MKQVIISKPYPNRKGRNFNGAKGTLVRQVGNTVIVKGLPGTFGVECIFYFDEVRIID